MAVITTNRDDTLDEFRQKSNDVSTFVGDTAQLDTDLTSDNLTDAVNEHESDLYKSTEGSFDGLSATNFKGAIEEVVDELGQVTEFATDTQNIGEDTTAVSAIKTLDTLVGEVTYVGTNNLTSETSIIGGITELDTQLGKIDWTDTHNILATATVETAIKTIDTDLGEVVFSGTNNLDDKTTIMDSIYEIDVQLGTVDFTGANNLNADDTVVQAITTLDTDLGKIDFSTIIDNTDPENPVTVYSSNNLTSVTTVKGALDELDAQLGTIDWTGTKNILAAATVETAIKTLDTDLGEVVFTGTNNISTETTVMDGIKSLDTHIGDVDAMTTGDSTIIAGLNTLEDYIGGSYTPLTITALSRTSNVATATVANEFEAGDIVTISGSSASTFNGTHTVVTANATQFTFANTGSNIASVATPGVVTPVRSGAKDTQNAIALVENYAGYGTTLSIGDNLADGINDLNSAKLNKASATAQALSSDIVYSGDMEVTGSISITSGELIVAGGAGSLNLSTSYIDIGDKTLETTPATLGIRFNRGQNTVTETENDLLVSSAIFYQESDSEFYVRTPKWLDEAAGIEGFDDDKIVTFRNSSDLFGNTASTGITKSVNSNGVVTFGFKDNSIALGTKTTGNYVATISGTTNEVEVTGSGSETAAVTIGLPNSVTVTNGVTAGNLLVGGSSSADSDIVQQGTVNDHVNINLNSTSITGDKKLKTNANFESSKDVKGATLTSSGKATLNSLEVTNNTVIKGNLTVEGTTTTVNTETIALADNIIELNSNLSATTAPTQNGGIQINRGSKNDVSLYWNETNDVWQVGIPNGSDVVTNHEIMTGFILEDGDSTEVTISNNKEIKFVEGTGSGASININWTDTTDGTDTDPYDLTFSVTNTDKGSAQNIFKTISPRNSDNSKAGTDIVADNNNDTLVLKEAGGIALNGDGTSTITVAHADTSSQASVNNSGGNVIQDITLDTYGHITAISSLSGDGRWVNKTGDTMTGNLNFSDTGEGITWEMNTDGASIKFYNTADSDTDSRLEFNTRDNGNEYFRWTTTSGSSTYELANLKLSGTTGILKVSGEVNSPVFEGITTAHVRAGVPSITNASGYTTTIEGGKGKGSGAGGQVNIYGGDVEYSSSTGNGGDVYLLGGQGGSAAGLAASMELFGAQGDGSGAKFTIDAGKGVGSNKAGPANTIHAGYGTGTGTASKLQISTSKPVASGSTLHGTKLVLDLQHDETDLWTNLKIDNGTRTTVNIISDDTGQSELNLYGSSQGTGRIYVGQSTTYGGGIGYWGDATQSSPEFPTGFPTDDILFYRRTNGTEYWTAGYSHDSDNWNFAGDLYVNGGGVYAAPAATNGSGNGIAIEGTAANGTGAQGGYVKVKAGDAGGSSSGAAMWLYPGVGGGPGAVTLNAGYATGTNKNGSNVRIIGGKGTGTGTGSYVRIEASEPVASGSTGHNNHAVADFKWNQLDMLSNDIRNVADIYLESQIFSDGDTDTYLQFHAANEFRVVTGGGERFEVTNTSVTTAPKLYANGGIRLQDNDYLEFGSSADVEMYHNGSALYTDINSGMDWYIRDGNSSNANRFAFDIDNGRLSLTTVAGFNVSGTDTNGGHLYLKGGLGYKGAIPQSGAGAFFGAGGTGYNLGYFDIEGGVATTTDNNANGVENHIRGGRGTGSGTGSKISFWASVPTSSGTTQHTQNKIATIDSSGLDVFYDLNVSGTIYETSDQSVKENVITIDKAIDNVADLRGVYFNKIGEVETQIGVIAQEVEKVIPEVVKTDDGLKSVAYANMVGLLIEAIKDLKSEIEDIKSKI